MLIIHNIKNNIESNSPISVDIAADHIEVVHKELARTEVVRTEVAHTEVAHTEVVRIEVDRTVADIVAAVSVVAGSLQDHFKINKIANLMNRKLRTKQLQFHGVVTG